MYQNAKQEAFWGPVEGRLMAMFEGVNGQDRGFVVTPELATNPAVGHPLIHGEDSDWIIDARTELRFDKSVPSGCRAGGLDTHLALPCSFQGPTAEQLFAEGEVASKLASIFYLARDAPPQSEAPITSHRIAGQSEIIVSRSNTEQGMRQRAQAEEYERARQLRAQYREQVAEQQLGKDTEPEQIQEPSTQEAEPEVSIPRQRGDRGQRTSRGRAERTGEQQVEEGDTDTGDTTQRHRAQRGEPTPESSGISC